MGQDTESIIQGNKKTYREDTKGQVNIEGRDKETRKQTGRIQGDKETFREDTRRQGRYMGTRKHKGKIKGDMET